MKNGMQYRKLRNQNIKFNLDGTTMLENKKLSLSLAGYLKLVGASYRNVLNCNNLIVVGIDKQKNVQIRHTSRCKHRLCPNCQKVKFQEDSIMNAKILDKMVKQKPKGHFTHSTFSCENAYDEKSLHDIATKLSKAITIFFGYKKIDKHTIGFISTIEDKPSFNRGSMEYNIHSHVTAYIDQDINVDIKKYWKRALKRVGLHENGYIYSKPIKATKGHSALDNAKTTINYDSKPYNWLDDNLTKIKSKKNRIKAINDHVKALYNMKCIKYYGQCQTIHQNIRNVSKAKRILRQKDNKTDVVQMLIHYNSKKHNYYYTGIQIENNYLSRNANSINELQQYRDSQPYAE